MNDQFFKALVITVLAVLPFVAAQILFSVWLHKAKKLRDEIQAEAERNRVYSKAMLELANQAAESVKRFTEALDKDRAIRLSLKIKQNWEDE